MIPKVNIYIETTFKSFSQKSGSAMYVLEFITSGGEIRTREGSLEKQQGKELQLILKAAAAAMVRLNKACEITIHTTCRLIKTAVDNEWIEAWRQQGWRKTNGTPLLHAEEWKAFGEAAEKHLIYVEVVPTHSYKEWMKHSLQQNDRRTI